MSYVNVLPHFEQALDWNVVKDIERFFIKIIDRQLFKMGVLGQYSDEGDVALGLDVEYFLPNICADERMRYIGQNIALEQSVNLRNRFCNAVITHLYGGRRINTLFTGITDPKKAHVDFERVNTDAKYVQEIYDNAAYARSHGFKFYGTTELHTSLQTAARNFVRKKYSEPDRPASNTDIVEWVAGWIDSGFVDDLTLNTSSLSEAFKKINTLPGVGAYYGYHLGVDTSLLPEAKFHHNEPFCVPGPGCCETLDLLFPTLKQKIKKMPYGDLIVWQQQNQQKLFPKVEFHESLWNIQHDVTGHKLFDFEQNQLMVYALEVGECQHGVYRHLSKNQHLIERRKCGSDPDLSAIIARENGAPIEPSKKQKKEILASTKASCLLEF